MLRMFQHCVGDVINELLFGYPLEADEKAKQFFNLLTNFNDIFMGFGMQMVTVMPFLRYMPFFSSALKKANGVMGKVPP